MRASSDRATERHVSPDYRARRRRRLLPRFSTSDLCWPAAHLIKSRQPSAKMSTVTRYRLLLVRPACHLHSSTHFVPRHALPLQRPSRHFHRCSRLRAEVTGAAVTSTASSPASPPLPPSPPPPPPPAASSRPTLASSQQPRSPSTPSSSSSTFSPFDVLGIALFLGLSGVTFYLGTWQLQRKQWKEKSVPSRCFIGQAVTVCWRCRSLQASVDLDCIAAG